MSEPKSGKNRRVYMTAELRDTLRALYRERFERVAAIDAKRQAELESAQAADAADAWIFTNTEGGMIDPDNLRRRVFVPLLTAAELRKVRIHDLRHGYASLLLAAGKPLKFAQQQLGHHSAGFTLDTYGHLLRGDHEGLVDLSAVAPAGTPMAPSTADSAEGAIPESEKALAVQGL